MTPFTLEPGPDAVHAFIRDNPLFTELIVFLLGFGEGVVLVSLFVPSTILFLAIGGMHSAAGGEFWPLWLSGAAGACFGDCVSYALGRYFKRDAHSVWPMGKHPVLLRNGRALFQRWGAISIIGGKFLGGVRPFIALVAGTFDMPWALFLGASAISSLMWAGVFLSPGYGISLLLR
jgi:membrane protein DedA with SNARE-associated domain